jgi:hypothetical protein
MDEGFASAGAAAGKAQPAYAASSGQEQSWWKSIWDWRRADAPAPMPVVIPASAQSRPMRR